nr:hypothetical protein [Bacteroidota bacterium]
MSKKKLCFYCFPRGLKDHTQNYVIIGGTACDIHIEVAGFTPRATKDIDIILIVEALDISFVKRYWEFIKAGNYTVQEKSTTDRNYYRFMKPENKAFPKQVELFSRKPNAIQYEGEGHFTPIPSDADFSSLSAILMDDEYYNFTIKHSSSEEGLHHANPEALICLKAKAFLDMKEQKAKGEQVDDRHIKKHKSDVFRLALLLAPANTFVIPKGIKTDMLQFVDIIKDELPDKYMFKAMG